MGDETCQLTTVMLKKGGRSGRTVLRCGEIPDRQYQEKNTYDRKIQDQSPCVRKNERRLRTSHFAKQEEKVDSIPSQWYSQNTSNLSMLQGEGICERLRV
eukprot:768654-Hanusia_phi.AAC.2